MDDELKAILPNNKEASAERMGERYYGTNKIKPDEAFNNGIPLKGMDRRLLEHLEGNEQSAFRGTTVFSNVNPHMGQGAAMWADEGGWVYQIGPVKGWDPGRLLEGLVEQNGRFQDSPTMMELEVTVPSRIEPHLIIKAGIVEEIDVHLVVRKWEYNPNYPIKK